jgi:hypothetical protein
MKIIICILLLLTTPIVWGQDFVKQTTKKPELIPVEPHQLYGLIANSDRMVITESPIDGAKVLFTSSNPDELKLFSDSLVLKKPEPEKYFHCMCIGEPSITFYKGTNETVHLTNHHGQSIRCSLWSSDVAIANVEKWMQWFDNHGITSIREEVEFAEKQAKIRENDWESWTDAMPQCLEPIWEDSLGNFGMVDTKPLSKVLKQEIPNKTERILALLEWYGSGSRRWSGFPTYEQAAETILLEFDTKDIVEAIQSTQLTESQIEGGARLFGGWTFSKKRPKGLNEVPKELKQMFWNQVKSTDDEDKLGRAERAFTK